MRIGIDAHSIGSAAGGNETYYRFLVEWLPRVASGKDSYIFYLTNGSAVRPTLPNQEFRFKQIRPANPLVRIPVSLPFELWREKVDVFHAQYILPPFCRCKTVVSIFDLAYEHYPELFHPVEAARSKLLVLRAARKADHIVTLSHYSAGDIARTYTVDPGKITVTYLAAGCAFFPRDKEACRDLVAKKYGFSDPFILYVGRLQARKNLPRLLEAYARVRRDGARKKLVLVGKKDWMYEKIVQRVTELRLESDVIFTGYAAKEELPILYNAAEVFVFPSVFEGFGLPIVEAMACGVPVITSFGSSLEEIAGDAALLVDPFSTDSLENAIRKLLGSPDLKQHLAEKGLRRSAQFSCRRAAAQTIEVYEKVLGTC
jgi:glycosyltransferase involved in cell wall biosynthesis